MIGEERPTKIQGKWSMRRRLRLSSRHRRRLPPMSLLPTLCTLANLVAGFAAIHYAAREPSVHLLWRDWTPLTFAGALVFVGMILDAIDGTLARLTRSNSELGGQLDSLADVITFGVAPAFMALQVVSRHLQGEQWIIGPEADNVFGKIIWAAAAVYVCCAALRLARFNVEIGVGAVNDHSLFRGLPSPGAAGTIASLVILHQHLLAKFADAAAAGTQGAAGATTSDGLPMGFAQWSALGIPFIMLLCAFGMVSNIPYIHFANRYFRAKWSYRYVVRLVVVIALLVWVFQYTLAAAFTAYALSGPVKLMLSKLRRRHATTVTSNGSLAEATSEAANDGESRSSAPI